MSSNTVAEFATELKKSPETLLDQLKAAGVGKAAPSDALTELDKQKLLAYLQASHGTASADRKKITLVKKSTSEIKQADATGKARTIQVEVRKKRTFIQRDEGVESATESTEPEVQEAAVSSEDIELARREEEASRQAELIRLQEAEFLGRDEIRLVHDDDVRDFQNPRLLPLHRVPGTGLHQNDDAIHEVSDRAAGNGDPAPRPGASSASRQSSSRCWPREA